MFCRSGPLSTSSLQVEASQVYRRDSVRVCEQNAVWSLCKENIATNILFKRLLLPNVPRSQCMYVCRKCMYVRMYVMYVRACVCMYVWNVRMHVMHVRVYVCIKYMYVWNVCSMYAFMYVCTYIIPLQAWTGPEGSRKLRFLDFVTTARDGGKVVSLTNRPPLPPRMYAHM